VQKKLIVTALDDAYIYPLFVMIFSLQKNISIEYKLLIGYDKRSLSIANRNSITHFMRHFKIQFDFYEIEIPKGWPSSHHISALTFSKLIFANELSQKFIWIDIDTLIRKPIDELLEKFDVVLENNYISARSDLRTPNKISETKEQGSNTYFFNAGVLLIDGKKWTDRHHPDIVINLIFEGLDWLDQGVFNRLAEGEFSELPAIYNYFVGHDIFSDEVRISHYLGKQKPWNLPRTRIGKLIVLSKTATMKPYTEYEVAQRDLLKAARSDIQLHLKILELKKHHLPSNIKILKKFVRNFVKIFF
jgi:lipopolysaccharide biosynthesis glycosyltransferase